MRPTGRTKSIAPVSPSPTPTSPTIGANAALFVAPPLFHVKPRAVRTSVGTCSERGRSTPLPSYVTPRPDRRYPSTSRRSLAVPSDSVARSTARRASPPPCRPSARASPPRRVAHSWWHCPSTSSTASPRSTRRGTAPPPPSAPVIVTPPDLAGTAASSAGQGMTSSPHHMNGLGADGGCLGAGHRIAADSGAADCRTNHAEHRAKQTGPANTYRAESCFT